ncbi:alpha/beta fold hydrolase [Streptomyces sp. G45]|uniref:alpha/beta fold hydrolase n=1 Tax=Streptomyces sp. G45 TaxID=3406627 RepID=UPI003C1D6163
MMNTMTLNGVEIGFDDQGYAFDGPTLVLLPGWAHDLRAFDRLLPYLRTEHRVVRVCWRGHGPDRTPLAADWGVEEQVDDTIALLDALEVESFVPVSHAHGGWVSMGMAERLGAARVPRLLLLDLIMTPPPAEFTAAVRALQSRDTWRQAREDLLRSWLDSSDNEPVRQHTLFEAGGHGFDMWARSGREVERAYATWGSPMDRLAALTEPRPVRHVFSHPKAPEYDEIHARFQERNPWFSYRRLNGETHFPGIELPEEVAAEIRTLLSL